MCKVVGNWPKMFAVVAVQYAVGHTVWVLQKRGQECRKLEVGGLLGMEVP